MKTALIATALCATNVCWAAPGDGHIDGPQWSVDYNTHFGGQNANVLYDGETAVSLQGGSLFWATDALTWSSSFVPLIPLRPRGAFDFTPVDGYVISGFDIIYDITLATTPFITDGHQYSLSGVQLAPGTVIAGTGSFATSTGAADNFSYLHTAAVLTDHLTSGAPFSFESTLKADSGEYDDCTFWQPGIFCELFGGPLEVRAFLTLNSITITPTVSAVPEPETYALMLGGLALLMRRRRATRSAARLTSRALPLRTSAGTAATLRLRSSPRN